MLIPLTFIAIMGAFGLLLFKFHKRNNKKREDLGDEDLMESMQKDSWGKFDLFLSKAEQERFHSFPRKAKRNAMKLQQKLLGKGELYICENHAGKRGLITRKEALRTGLIKNTDGAKLLHVAGDINMAVEAVQVE